MKFTKVLALGATMMLVAGANPARAANIEVKIDNFVFNPQQVTVHAGDTVTWVNHDDIPHTVVAKDKGFRSKALDTDDRYSFTFASAGTYDYFCGLHPHMTGKIVVTP